MQIYMVILILFRKSKILKNFNKKLTEMNIFYKNENNDKFINYHFMEKDINKLMYHMLYYNLNIQNEEFFIKLYYKQNKLSEKDKLDWKIQQFTRFGK